jgi:hypothetical protein
MIEDDLKYEKFKNYDGTLIEYIFDISSYKIFHKSNFISIENFFNAEIELDYFEYKINILFKNKSALCIANKKIIDIYNDYNRIQKLNLILNRPTLTFYYYLKNIFYEVSKLRYITLNFEVKKKFIYHYK